jgi:hypothetical protein
MEKISKAYLEKELARLQERRKEPNQLPCEYDSLDGSIATVKKFLRLVDKS